MMSTSTSVAAGVVAILLGGTGIWLQSDSHQQLAMEELDKLSAKVHKLEDKLASKTSAVRAKLQEEFPHIFTGKQAPAALAAVEGVEARSSGAAAWNQIVVAIVAVNALLLAVVLYWYFFLRASHPPVVMKPKGALTVKVVSAHNLPNLDQNAKVKTDVTDAYVEVQAGGKKKVTKCIKDNLNPTWNEVLGPFELDFTDKKKEKVMKTLGVQVFDKDGWFASSPLVGEVMLDCQEVVRSILEHEALHKDDKTPTPFQTVRVLDCHHDEKRADYDKAAPPAKITLELSYKPQPPPVSKKPAAPAAKAPAAPAAKAAAAPAAAH